MFEKIKNKDFYSYLQQFRDVRMLGLIAFGVVVLMVSWSGVRVIETNYRLEQQIARMEEQKKLRELEKKNKELENAYYRTNQYLELQARKSFGKAAPGEVLLLVPEEAALVRTIDTSEGSSENDSAQQSEKPFYQRNFEAWMDFFLRRTESG